MTMSPPSIQNDEKLQGECIAGAMVQTHLFAMLEMIGFTDISIIKRFYYRTVKDHVFSSITYIAYKPLERQEVEVIYPGPYAAVITDDGEILLRGEKCTIKKPFNPELLSPQILILDSLGNSSNIDAQNACCYSPAGNSSGCDCYTPPGESSPTEEKLPEKHSEDELQTKPLGLIKNSSECMVCGEKIEYLKNNEIKECFYCSKKFSANALCKNNHFVCDSCHGKDALEFVRELLINTKETDMIELVNKIRTHPSFNLHGPEHHFAIPGVITAVYKNLGGNITDKDIKTAIERGSSIPGGSCAFWGGCGAPLGAGIGFGVILDSNPLKPKQRQIVQQLVSEITGEIVKIKAARCCQRESWITLLKASELSQKYLGIHLPAKGNIVCTQMDQNKECIKAGCPFYEK